MEEFFSELRIGRKDQVQNRVPGRNLRHDICEPRKADECLQSASTDGNRLDHGIRTRNMDRQCDNMMDPLKSWMANTPEPPRADTGGRHQVSE